MIQAPPQGQTRESLRRSAARFQAVFEQAAVGIAVADREGTLIEVNGAFASLLGYEPDELVGQSFIDLTHPEDAPRARALLHRADRFRGPLITYEKRYVRKDGGVAWARATVSRLRDEDGAHEGYIAVVEDIGAARENETALATQARLHLCILDGMPLMISIWRDGRATYVNRAWQGTFGYTAAEAQQINLLDRMMPGGEADRARAFVSAQSGGWVDFEPAAKDGTRVLSTWLCTPLVDGSMMAIGQDVRERRRLESQLAQAQKMQALGQLAGGVAHDFNNLLTVIGGCAALIREHTGDDAESAMDLEEITKATQRAAALTRQLLAFSRQQLLHPEVVDVHEEIAPAAKTLKRLIGEGIELALVLGAERPCVEVDKHQLDQVVMNLVVNARDAVGGRGAITVATGNVSRVEPGGETREYLALSVSDDGCGIDPEIRDRIFEPFFTTKDLGNGTGLGLATVHGIVAQSGGRIEVDSQPGSGTTFRVLLPTVDARPVSAAPGRPRKASSSQETILLVEDETALRGAARRMLQGAGYRVLEARHGVDALDILGRHGVDMLVTDVIMPQMGGRELVERVQARWPSMPVLYMTGYTDDELLRKGVERDEAEVLRKPFQSAELLSAVAAVLNRAAAPTA